MRDGYDFDTYNAGCRVSAHLDTLRHHRIVHAIFGEFGCGAIMNPARLVAQIYREEIMARKSHFRPIAFEVLQAAYGPNVYTPFREVLNHF